MIVQQVVDLTDQHQWWGGPVVKGLSLYECHQILSDDRGITGCDLIILVFSFPAIMNEKL